MSRSSYMRRGFSLTELLVVMALIGLLTSLSMVAFTNVVRSSELTSGARQFEAMVSHARLHALTMGQVVEVRLYSEETPEGNTVVREIQALATNSQGVTKHVRPIQRLAGSVAVFPQWSTLLQSAPLTDSNTPSRNYWAFHIRPDARTNLAPYPTEKWCVTLAALNSESGPKPPPNFAVVSIDPINSIGRVFQP